MQRDSFLQGLVLSKRYVKIVYTKDRSPSLQKTIWKRMIRVGKMSWREISAMLGSCCSSMLFGLSFMFTKRIVGTVPAFSLLSWRFLMGAAAMSLCALLGVVHIDYKTKKPWPLLRMTLYLPAAYFIFETYGIELTSASESGPSSPASPSSRCWPRRCSSTRYPVNFRWAASCCPLWASSSSLC